MAPDISPLAEAAAPAGGAETSQVIIMFAALTVAFGALIALGEAHRRGRRTPLGAAAAFASRVGGLPQWVALPLAVVAVSLVGALFGYMWDVSLHIDRGRDPGPFANPSHYFILAGLYGIVAGGYLSSVLVKAGERPGRSAVRIAPDYYMPLGGALIVAAGAFALAGFPLDDLWHRLFGQDVTLWGPTHLIMLSGGLLTLVGVVILFEEGVAVAGKKRTALGASPNGKPEPIPGPARHILARVADLLPSLPLWPTRALIAGGFLAGLSIYQGEFDYGVPQFELVLQPLMIAGSAGLALVAARVWLGKGGALAATAWYLLIRGAVWLIVGPILGETHPAMPLYIPEALVIEAAALAIARRPDAKLGGSRALIFGPVAGFAAGAIGFFAEWPWINQVFAIHWNSALLPEGPVIATIAGAAGGMIGALFGLALKRQLPERPRLVPSLAAGSLVVVMACFAFGLADRTPSGASAQVTLADVKTGPEREVLATVRFTPASVADGASWVREIAWQGGGLVGAPLEKISPGVYRTPEPIPVYGKWKSAIRIQNGHTLLGVPIFARPDPAIPDAGVAAPASFTRPLENDRVLLQRERKDDVPGWLFNAASLFVLLMGLVFLSLLGLAVGRYARGPRRDEPDTEEPARKRRQIPTTPTGVRA